MNINPRDLQKAMQRMGIQQKDLDAQEVIIRLADKDIIISNPSVAKVNMMGQESYQVSGAAREVPRSTTPDIKEEDIKTVMEQTGKTHDEALAAIQAANGDLAEAILTLTQ